MRALQTCGTSIKLLIIYLKRCKTSGSVNFTCRELTPCAACGSTTQHRCVLTSKGHTQKVAALHSTLSHGNGPVRLGHMIIMCWCAWEKFVNDRGRDWLDLFTFSTFSSNSNSWLRRIRENWLIDWLIVCVYVCAYVVLCVRVCLCVTETGRAMMWKDKKLKERQEQTAMDRRRN